MNQYEQLAAQWRLLSDRLGRRQYWHDRALHNRLCRLHPETAGHWGLIHNWGNAAAREALAKSQARLRAYWRHIDSLRDMALREAMAKK